MSDYDCVLSPGLGVIFIHPCGGVACHLEGVDSFYDPHTSF